MAYLVYNISECVPEDKPLYFCDANVWIAALKYYCAGGGVTSQEEPYQRFMEAIIELHTNNVQGITPGITHKPKIVVTSTLLSEIINTYMRNVAMKTFYGGGEEYRSISFKSGYRDNPQSDYRQQLEGLCTDLLALMDYTVLVNDEFSSIDLASFFYSLYNDNVDFNDQYFYYCIRDKGIPIITHDKDFLFNDIPIITAQRALLIRSTIAQERAN